MLCNLKIENIAIIEHLAIDFTQGFNCLTGETGAGKSIIIDSINAVMGGRTSRELIRTGESTASVSAYFTNITSSTVAMIEELGLKSEQDGSLLVSRVMYKDGRNICKVNGETATISMLRKICPLLINIHGQSDNQQLLDPTLHFMYLDRLAGCEALVAQYRQSLSALYEIKRKIKTLTMDNAEKERRADLLTYQIKEIEQVNIHVGEYDELKERQQKIINSKKIISALSKAYNALSGSDSTDGASSLLFEAANAMNSIATCSKEYSENASLLSDLGYSVNDVSERIAALLSDSDFDEGELDVIEERLDAFSRLKKKYGANEEEILSYLKKCRDELDTIESLDDTIKQLKVHYEEQYENTKSLALKLSSIRTKTAEIFCKNVQTELEALDMPGTIFTFSQKQCPFNENGIDEIEFLLSANVGESPRPLAKIASGGELSRIMLAIKNVLSECDDVATLIFDEIDSGVSGSAAGKIADRLMAVSKRRQVICITHLPVIAAAADNHMLIKKTADGEKTYTYVTVLDKEGRALEISRMTAGKNAGDSVQLEAARAILEDAENRRKNI